MLRRAFVTLFACAGGPAIIIFTIWLRLQGWSALEAFLVTFLPLIALIVVCYRILMKRIRKARVDAQARYEAKMGSWRE